MFRIAVMWLTQLFTVKQNTKTQKNALKKITVLIVPIITVALMCESDTRRANQPDRDGEKNKE
tara:strand:+ start:60 stop:248 length:189 start_codon:yes stop_codon:yes gene_type:complete